MTEQASMFGAVRDREPNPDEVDRLIERRAANAEHADDPDEREASWEASVAAFHAEHREARRHLWVTYFRTLSRNHAAIAEHFEEKATKLQKGSA